MNWSGLSDSLAMTAVPKECPHCGASARLSRGLCLGCLLGSALDDGSDPVPNDFAAVLDAVPAPDTLWRLGNYEILEEIGRGGMGVIYRARQRHSRRVVALKRVLSYHAESRETLTRFRREAEAASSLDHPNILPIYEVGETKEGIPYFSMKYAPGGTLQDLGQALSDDRRQIVRILARVTRAVLHAHRQGILHRDLKPGNILLDGRGEPLVSDFGLAKWLNASTDLTRTLTIFGTPGYIAPEQAEGPAADLTPTADIYSLGAILFDLLAGRPPFLGEHALAVIRQAADKPAPKLRSLVPGAGKDLETICARCLEREPTARYRSAVDLAEDLERWLEGRPINARPVSSPLRLWRWGRRNPALAAAAVIALLLGVTVLHVQSGRSQLRQTLNAATAYKRSITILPFLDLDSVSSNRKFTKSLSVALQRKIGHFGPANISDIEDNKFAFAGVGTMDDIRAVCSRANTRTAMTGTVRSVNGKHSVSIQLVDAFWAKTLVSKCLTVEDYPSSEENLAALIAGELSSALNGELRIPEPQLDPALTDKEARVNMSVAETMEQSNGVSPETAALCLHDALNSYEAAIMAAPSSSLARANFVLAVIRIATVDKVYDAAYDKRDLSTVDLLAKAEALGKTAVQLDPTSGYAYRALGLLYSTRGEPVEAREAFFNAIEQKGLEEGAGLLISVAQDFGRPDLAIKWWKVQQHWFRVPDHSAGKPLVSRYLLGSEFEERMIAECWSDLSVDARVEAIYGRNAKSYELLDWISLCRLRLQQGDFGAAQRLCQENLRKADGFPDAKIIEAEIHLFSRNFGAAEKCYSAIIQEDFDSGPTRGGPFAKNVSARSALGRIAMQKGDTASARSLLEKCLQTDKANLLRRPARRREIYYDLSAAEACLGERDAAIGYLKEAFAAGWLDYRSPSLDPRFDFVRDDDRFHEILKTMSARVDSLRQSLLADWKD